MKITLYQLSSYYLIFLLFPLVYRLQYVRNSSLIPTRHYYPNYIVKNVIIFILILINIAMIVLRAALNASILMDPIYFVLQLIVLAHLFIQNYCEKGLGLKSPMYTFFNYFMVNTLYLMFCNIFYLANGYNCEYYRCGRFNNLNNCYSCRSLPMIADKLTIDEGIKIISHEANGEILIIIWIYIELMIFFNIFGIYSE